MDKNCDFTPVCIILMHSTLKNVRRSTSSSLHIIFTIDKSDNRSKGGLYVLNLANWICKEKIVCQIFQDTFYANWAFLESPMIYILLYFHRTNESHSLKTQFTISMKSKFSLQNKIVEFVIELNIFVIYNLFKDMFVQ